MSKTLDVMTFGDWIWGGSTGFAQYKFSDDFVDEYGVAYSATSYLEVPTTIVGNVVTVPAYPNFPETEAAVLNNGVTVTCHLLDSTRAKKAILFDSVRIYTSLSSPIGLTELVLANGASRLLRDDDVWTKEQVIDYVATRPPAVKMTSLVYGVGRLSTPAGDPADPIAVGDNDPRLAPASTYASLAAAVTAIGATPTTLIVSTADFPSGASITVPATLILDFRGPGSLLLTTGHTVIIRSDGSNWPTKKIFGNANAGQGTVLIGGRVSTAWWGAKGDGGVTDNKPPVQAAIEAAAATATGGGVVEFPAASDFYGFLSGLSLSSKRNVTLIGPAFNSGAVPYGAELRFTGSGTGSFIDAQTSYGIQVKRLFISYSNAGFTGRLLDFRGSVSLSTQHVAVDEVALYGNGARDARSLIDFDRVINSRITNSLFLNADLAIQGGFNYANSILIQGNTFHNLTSTSIRDTGEAWTIQANTFQSLYNAGDVGPAGAIDYTVGSKPGRGVMFTGNWLGDVADPGTGAWIKYHGDALVVQGNMVSLATGNTFFLVDANSMTGNQVSHNGVQRTGSGGANPIVVDFGATSGHVGWVIGPNQYDANITEVSGTLPSNSVRINKSSYLTANGGIQIGDTAPIIAHRSVTYTWNPGNLAAGASESFDAVIGGVGVGDPVVVGFPMLVGGVAQAGMQISGTCAVAGTVKVTITNTTAGAVNLDSGTLRVDGWIH